jgi:Flp pilus assembly protein TadG
MMKSLRKDNRGAVLAEFIIAIVPILTAFFCFVQLAHIAGARLAIKHGAIVGARAAAVITNKNDNTPGQTKGDNQADVKAGVQLAMMPWILKGSISNVNVTIDDQSTTGDTYGWVTVTVKANYNCFNVPMSQIICAGRNTEMTEVAKMPHQGANYK